MTRIVYIGDELTAAGYRLAGVETATTAVDDLREVIGSQLHGGADLLLVSAAAARGLSAAELAEALLRTHPLLTVVPDVHGRDIPPDLEKEVRLTLGIEA